LIGGEGKKPENKKGEAKIKRGKEKLRRRIAF